MTPARVFLTASWRNLVLVNFAVDPPLLAPFVPDGTRLDAWNGRVLVSAVGFQFLDTRIACLARIPVPFHRDFEEVNLRFYVRREHPEGVRRGVVFIKEIVPRRAIAATARWLYNENYVALPMTHRIADAGNGTLDAAYSWKRADRTEEVGLVAAGESFLPASGSEEEFVTEHYWGYVRQRDGSTVEYQVEHPRWKIRRAASARLVCDPAALYGSGFGPALQMPPISGFLADGSDVIVRRGKRLEG